MDTWPDTWEPNRRGRVWRADIQACMRGRGIPVYMRGRDRLGCRPDIPGCMPDMRDIPVYMQGRDRLVCIPALPDMRDIPVCRQGRDIPVCRLVWVCTLDI